MEEIEWPSEGRSQWLDGSGDQMTGECGDKIGDELVGQEWQSIDSESVILKWLGL